MGSLADVKNFFDVVDYVLKNPSMIPIAVALLLVVGVIVWMKGLKKDQKETLSDIKTEIVNFKNDVSNHIDNKIDYIMDDIKEIKEQQVKFNNRHEIYEKLYNDFPIFDFFAKNFNQEKNDIFTQIQSQLEYMRRAFEKNYTNGSHREEADRVLNKAEEIITETIDGAKVKDQVRFNNLIFIFLKFLRDAINTLISELDKMTSPQYKSSLINSEFSLLNKTVFYLKLKYPTFLELDDDAILAEIIQHYLAMNIKPPISKIEETSLLSEIKEEEREKRICLGLE